MRRLLPFLLVLVFAAPADAAVRTLGAHNEIVVDGVGYVDVRIEKDTAMATMGYPEGSHIAWTIRSDRDDGYQAVILRSYAQDAEGRGHVATAPGHGGRFGLSLDPLPAGDYRLYAASPSGPATITIDIEGFEGDRRFTPDVPVTGGGGNVPKIAELEDGTDVYGRSVHLDTPGWLFLELDASDDGGAVYETAGGCQPAGRATEPVAEDFGPGCRETGYHSNRNQIGWTSMRVAAGWNGFGGWATGYLGDAATRNYRALWIADGPPMTAPSWPADAQAPAASPAPAKAEPQPAARKAKKGKKRRAAKRRHARRRG